MVLLGAIVPALNRFIGMPLETLYLLAALPLVFGIYDLVVYNFADLSRPVWLRLIMAANLGYCMLTIALMVVHSDQLKPLGFAYFIAEQPVLVALVGLQYKVGRRTESTG